MESKIVQNLRPAFEPVAVVWSDTISDDAFQFRKGKFGCILYLFAEASCRGKIAGGSRESVTCTGGLAALGLGVGFDASDELLDRYAAVFSKGLKSADNQSAYRARMEPLPGTGALCMSMVNAGTAMRNSPKNGYGTGCPASTSHINTYYSNP